MHFELFVEPKSIYADKPHEWQRLLRGKLGVEQLRAVRLITHFTFDGIDQPVFEIAKEKLAVQPVLCTTWEQRPDIPGYCFALGGLESRFDYIADYLKGCLDFLEEHNDAAVKISYLVFVDGTLDESQRRRFAQQIGSREELEGKSLSNMHRLEERQDRELINFRFLDEKMLEQLRYDLNLHISMADLLFCQSYYLDFANRDPQLLEIQIADMLWKSRASFLPLHRPYSDFHAQDEFIYRSFQDYLQKSESLQGRHFDVTLYEIMNMPRRFLRHQGMLTHLREFEDSDHSALSVAVTMPDGATETGYLQINVNSRTCLEQDDVYDNSNRSAAYALMDAAAARGQVFGAMRVGATGLPDPAGIKTGDRTLHAIFQAADGYQSYAAGCGIPTLFSHNCCDDGWDDCCTESTAVVSVSPEAQMQRKSISSGDLIILISAEENKNDTAAPRNGKKSSPVVGRRMLHLFENTDFCKIIKRSRNGSAGIMNALFRLCDGARVSMDRMLEQTGKTLWQEMLSAAYTDFVFCVVSQVNIRRLEECVKKENLSCRPIASYTGDSIWRFCIGNRVVAGVADEFLRSMGARKMVTASIDKVNTGALLFEHQSENRCRSAEELFVSKLHDPNFSSEDPIVTRMAFSVGCGSLLAPLGGRYHTQMHDVLAAKIPLHGEITDTAAVAGVGFLQQYSDISPYHNAYYSAVHAYTRLIAAGCSPGEIFLSPSVEFATDREGEIDYSQAIAIALGYYQAQMDLQTVCLQTSFRLFNRDRVKRQAPSITTFSLSHSTVQGLISSSFCKAGSKVYLLTPSADLQTLLPEGDNLHEMCEYVSDLIRSGKIRSARALGLGGIGEAVCKMCLGNHVGFHFRHRINPAHLWEPGYGCFLVETDEELNGELLGYTKDSQNLFLDNETISLATLEHAWRKNSDIHYKSAGLTDNAYISETLYGVPSPVMRSRKAMTRCALPRVYIPVFRNDQSEVDLRRRFMEKGAIVTIDRFVTANRYIEDVAAQVINHLEQSQILVLTERAFSPMGFGAVSGKMVALLQYAPVKEALDNFLYANDGLILGVGGGFCALAQADMFLRGPMAENPEFQSCLGQNNLYFQPNPTGSACCRMVQTRTVTRNSPWLLKQEQGDIYTSVFSMECGRLQMSDEAFRLLRKYDMIGSQFVDRGGNATMDYLYNPSLCFGGIESLISADGRILGKLCRFETIDRSLLLDAKGNKEQPIIESGISYFKD